MQKPGYPAKILLVGEYTVLLGGTALAVPFPEFQGRWCRADHDEAVPAILLDWVKYLLSAEGLKKARLDLQAFSAELKGGLRFCSDIPVGAGLGSSGALTAAVLDRFGHPPSDLQQLKAILGRMEAFFHGKSSGLDPLVSLVKQPLLTGRNTELVKPEIWDHFTARNHLFVWNSGLERETAPLVQQFTAHLDDPVFHEKITRDLAPANERAIQSVLNNDPEGFGEAWKAISSVQLECMDAMIPEPVRSIWEQGLSKGHYYMKLCGAGGGGHFLVYAPETLPEDVRHFGELKPLAPSGSRG